MQVAESYVYRNLDGGPGYVGRAPRGNFVKVANPGQTLTDEEVGNLGLDDLKDRTNYKKIIDHARANGIPFTVRNEDGVVHVVVEGGNE